MGDTLTLWQAEQRLLEHNAELRSARLACTEAELAARQARLWDNPTLAGLYNAYNPLNGIWLDPGSEGEVDISASQPLPIGRRHRVRLAEAGMQAAQAEAEWATFVMRMQLKRVACEVWALGERAALVEKELGCVERILAAYRRQPQAVSAMELHRVEALRLSLLDEQAERAATLAERQAELALMLGSRGDISIAWSNGLFPTADASLPSPPHTTDTPWHSLLAAQAAQAEAEIQVQRAQALPQISLTAEYDKNGNIGHNFWAIGAEVTLPLWNRNRPSIRTAETARDRLRIEHEHLDLQRQQRIALAAARLDQCRRRLDQADSLASWDIAPAERQHLQRNLSLLELIDLYSAWRQAAELRIASRQALLAAAIDYNIASGTETIAIQ